MSMTHGATVTVATDQGREAGTVQGVQTDPTTGKPGWVTVEFADRTNSSWPVAKVEVV